MEKLIIDEKEKKKYYDYYQDIVYISDFHVDNVFTELGIKLFVILSINNCDIFETDNGIKIVIKDEKETTITIPKKYLDKDVLMSDVYKIHSKKKELLKQNFKLALKEFDKIFFNTQELQDIYFHIKRVEKDIKKRLNID